MLALLALTICLQNCEVSQPVVQVPPPDVVPPAWAPNEPDVAQAHYYYLPDIEVYYDSWNREFVYMDGGSWVYSSMLPPAYAGYDLYNQHVVVLDTRVYQPWVHHDLYVSHYPRYYYNSAYPGGRVGGGYAQPQAAPRGYLEGARRPIYNNAPVGGGRTAISPAPVNSTPVYQAPHTHDAGAAPQGPHQAQPVMYNGRNVGQPVPVSRGMMAPASQPSRGGGAPAPSGGRGGGGHR